MTRMLTLLLLTFTSLSLTACGDRTRPLVIPPYLLTCRDAAPVPKKPATNRQTVKFMKEERFAGADCRAKLGSIAELAKKSD